MERNSEIYQTYLQILKEELIPAFGCTEPVAIALAAAAARELLTGEAVRIRALLSGNIIKNAKSVTVPGTGGMKGIEAAVAAGVAAGDASKGLEVIAGISEEDLCRIRELLETRRPEIEVLHTDHILDIRIELYSREGSSAVQIQDSHDNIVLKEQNGRRIWSGEQQNEKKQEADRSLLNVRDIIDFADTAELSDIKELIGKQISYNMAIAKEGIEGNYGANIGKLLLKTCERDKITLAKAMAAAGSDARMSGCPFPVMIVSGSGNQGITASVPVAVYADEMQAGEEKKLRAVLLSDLITIHQKTGIGKLSAYCGAISAGCGSGAGIAYLHGGGYREIAHTLVNALAIASGVICDGAKASCAAKIAIAVESGIMGYLMFCEGQEFRAGDGIVTKGIEENIENIGRLAKEGMRETDKEILQIMVGRAGEKRERCQ